MECLLLRPLGLQRGKAEAARGNWSCVVLPRVPVTLFQEPASLYLSVVISDLQVELSYTGHLLPVCLLQAGSLQLSGSGWNLFV